MRSFSLIVTIITSLSVQVVEQTQLPNIHQAQSLQSLVSQLIHPVHPHNNEMISLYFNFYAQLFQRVTIICAMQYNQPNTITSLIDLITIIQNQIIRKFPIMTEYNTLISTMTWNRFSSIYFQYFADRYRDYFHLMTQINPPLTTHTFHSILTGLKDNIQHLEHDTMESIIANIIRNARRHHPIVMIDNALYSLIMEIFANTLNWFGATTVMIYLEEKTLLGIESVSMVANYKRSFSESGVVEFYETIQRLEHSPKTLICIAEIIMPHHDGISMHLSQFIMKEEDKQHFDDQRHPWMTVYFVDRNFKSALELLLDGGTSIYNLSETVWVMYSYMVHSITNVTELDQILLSFNDLNYTESTERNNKMDQIIFFTFQHKSIMHLPLNTYEIMYQLCSKSREYNNDFLMVWFGKDYEKHSMSERSEIVESIRRERDGVLGRNQKKIAVDLTPRVEYTYRILKRLQQLELGKQTKGYKNYIVAVPKTDRDPTNPLHPVTPTVREMSTKRKWEMLTRIWRRELHRWDSLDNNNVSSVAIS